MRQTISSIVFPLFLVILVTTSFTILSLTNFIENSNNIYDIKDHTNLNIILSNLHDGGSRRLFRARRHQLDWLIVCLLNLIALPLIIWA
jgi:hypothetical protein